MVRIVLGVFVVLHGAGHVAWLLVAFFPGSQTEPVSDRVLGGRVGADGAVAKAIGLVGTAAAGLFVAAAVGVFASRAWWFTPGLAGVVASAVVAVAWWNPVGVVSVMALLADAGLLAARLIPWIEETAGLS